MRPLGLLLATILVGVFTTPAQSQLLPSQAKGGARAQVVMLNVNGSVAAGIVAGFDDDKIYIATAAHIADLGSAASPGLDVRFDDAPEIPRSGSFLAKFDPSDKLDIAVVVVNRDDSLRAFLNGLDFAMLSPVSLPPTGSPVTSIGYSGGSTWTAGLNESMLPAEQGNLHFTSDVGEGQSGGAVYNDAWELIGMAVRSGAGSVYARPIEVVIKALKNWDVPVRLTPRSIAARVKGADELARENERRAQRALRRNLAQRLASQSDRSRIDSPVRSVLLGAEAVNATREDGVVIAAAREALANSLHEIGGSGLSGHTDHIFSTTFSSDDSLLATMSRDGTIRVWSLADPSAPKCVKVLKETEQGDYTISAFIAFDKQSKSLISQVVGSTGSAKNSTSPKIWPLDTPGLNSDPKWLLTDRTPAVALAVSQSRDLLAVADVRGRLSIYQLGQTLDRPLRVLSSPTGHVLSHLGFSRDGTVVLGGTADAWAVIWDLNASGDKPVTAFDTGHRQRAPFDRDLPHLNLLDISNDHALLLTGSSHWSIDGGYADPTLRIWPLQHLIPKRIPWVIDQSGVEPNKVLADGFFDDSSRFVIGVTSSGTINAWELAKARFDGTTQGDPPIARTKGSTFVETTARSLDRGLLVISQQNTVWIARVAEIIAGKSLGARKLAALDGSVESVSLSNSARFLVAGGVGGAARLWDLSQVDPATPSLAPSPYADAKGIYLSETGKTVLALRGNALELWDIEKPFQPKLRYTTEIDLKQFEDCVACRVVVSPDSRWMALQSPTKDRSRIIEVGADASARREFAVATRTWSATHEIVFSPNSRWLFVGEANDVRVVYDLQSASIERNVFSDTGSYSAPTFSRDGKWVVFERYVNEFRDPIGRDKVVGFIAPTSAVADPRSRVPITGFATGVGSVEFSPDGRWVALSGRYSHPVREHDDRNVRVMHLDENGWTKRADLMPIEYAAPALRFSADGRWLLTGSSDVTLGDRNVSARLWNLAAPLTPTSGQLLPNVVWNLKLAAFSPDSRWLVTVSGAEQYARLWSLNGDKLEFVSKLTGPKPHLNNHWSVAFSSDSSSIALWTVDDATPFYWKLKGDSIKEFGDAIPNGGGQIEHLHFSSDGRVLTVLDTGGSTTNAGGANFTVVDLSAFPEDDSYAVLAAPAGSHSYVYREDLGLILASGESVSVMLTDLQSQMRHAQNIAGRNLSWDEWVRSGIAPRYRPTFPGIFVGADVIAAERNALIGLAKQQPTAEGDQLRRNLIAWSVSLDDAESCNDVAWELAIRRDLVNALELSSCALRLAPNDPNYRDTRGLILALSGHREEAISEFKYFVDHASGIERFALSVARRRGWIESLRAGGDPFVNGVE